MMFILTYLWVILVYRTQVNMVNGEIDQNAGKCRTRSGYHTKNDFKLRSCATCYAYLFPHEKELKSHPKLTVLVSINGTHFPHLTALTPDIDNATLRQTICLTLNDDECARWTQCCKMAQACCEKQLSEPIKKLEGPYCPRTWDGYGCWDDVSAGQTVLINCPSFIQHAVPSVQAYKYCTANGTWFRDPETKMEWTNYTTCLDIESLRTGIYVGIICNVISVAFLVPAVAVFLVYRALRSQHRIILHVNLFLSFIFYGIIGILWDTVVNLDRLVKPSMESLMWRNTPGCKLLYALTRYSRTTNYMWMFCEGLYLYRLLAKAFEPPRNLTPFLLLGWGFPFIPVGVYSILRTIFADKNCWVNHFGNVEWLLYVPNLIALGLNLIFLCNILRILLTQLQSHPNEPSNYRRALKATFILIPLFGVQLFVIIYRPPPDAPGSKEYVIISDVIVNSQGFFVALIFCFCNGEVLALVRRTWVRIRGSGYRKGSKPSLSMSTQMTTDNYSMSVCRTAAHRSNSNKTYIPLTPVREANGSSSQNLT